MTTEGGIDYDISISGNFDTKISGFIASVKELTKEVKGLSKGTSGSRASRKNSEAQKEAEASKETSKNLETVEKQEKDILKIRQTSTKETEKQTAAQKSQAAAVKQVEKAEKNILKQKELATKQSNIQALASEKNARAAVRVKVAEEQVRQAREAGISSAKEIARVTGLSESAVRNITGETKKATSQTNKLLLSFKQVLFTVLRFQIARRIFSFITESVNEMSRFSAEIEGAQMSMASIVATVGEVRTATGELAGGVTAFNAALRISDEVINQLRLDAARTEATFEGLIQAYQFAVGPGLEAGLNLDQIRQATLNLTRAATQMGVPVRGLNEEIRSILQGTIKIQNTRLGVLFNNEEIAKAKEAGNLFQLLTDRLGVYSETSDQVADTFNVLASNIKDATSVLLASGAVEYFESLKQLLRDVRGELVEERDGKDVLSEDALEIVENMSDGLQDIVKAFSDIVKNESNLEALKVISEAIGAALSAAGASIGIIFEIALGVLEDLSGIAEAVAEVFGSIATRVNGMGSGFKRVLTSAISLAIVSKALLSTYVAIRGALLLTSKITTFITGKQKLSVLLEARRKILADTTNASLATQLGLLTAIAAKSALITGGLTLVLGALTLFLADFITGSDEAVDNLGDLQEEAEKTAKAAEDLKSSFEQLPVNISAATELSKELQKTLENVSKQIEKSQAQLNVAASVRELSGEARKYSKIIAEGQEEARRGLEVDQRKIRLLEQQIAGEKQLLDFDTQAVNERTARLVEIRDLIDQIDKKRKTGNVDEERRNELVREYKRIEEDISTLVSETSDENIRGARESVRQAQRDYLFWKRKRLESEESLVVSEKEEVALGNLESAEENLTNLIVERRNLSAKIAADEEVIAELKRQTSEAEAAILKRTLLRVRAERAKEDSFKRQLGIQREQESIIDDFLELELERQRTIEGAITAETNLLQQRIAARQREAEIVGAQNEADLNALKNQLKVINATIDRRNREGGQEDLLELFKARNFLEREIDSLRDKQARQGAALALEIDKSIQKQEEFNEKVREQSGIREDNAAVQGRKTSLDLANREQEIERIKLQTSLINAQSKTKEIALQKQLVTEQERQVQAIQAQAAFDIKRLTKLRDTKTEEEDILEINKEIAEVNKQLPSQIGLATAKLEQQRAKLRELLGESQESITGAVEAGFREFALEAPGLADIISSTVKKGLNGVADTFGSQFSALIDPRKNPDWENAFADLFYGLAGDFASELAKQLLASQISGMLGGPAGDSSLSTVVKGLTTAMGVNTVATQTGTAATQVQTIATQADTAAKSTGAGAEAATGVLGAGTDLAGGVVEGVGNVAIVGLLTTIVAEIAVLGALVALSAGATLANTAIMIGNLALLGALLAVNVANLAANLAALPLLSTIAIFTVLDAVVPFAKGGMVKPFAKGGNVQGFAGGGSTAGLRTFQKANSIPKSDTVPAMLTPGEFVLVPDAVKKYGAGFLSALNKGIIDPSAVLGMPAAAIATGSGTGIKAFADGGMVSESTTSSANASRGAGTVIRPVLLADNTTMQQLTSGGRETFEKGVNGTNITGDPNRSKGWN